MARPRQVSDDAILEAAAEEFLARGTHATTNAIAARVGISEAILFRRFGSKSELLGAATRMALSSRAAPPTMPEGPLTRRVLERMAEERIAFFRQLIPLVLMHWAHLGRAPSEAKSNEELDDAAPVRAIHRFKAFFAERAKRGEICIQSPLVFTRTFIGTLWHFAFMEVAFPAPSLSMPSKVFISDFVSQLWSGIAPKRGAAPKRKKKP